MKKTYKIEVDCANCANLIVSDFMSCHQIAHIS